LVFGFRFLISPDAEENLKNVAPDMSALGEIEIRYFGAPATAFHL
jgi:hypothetical protein